jgi:hypothetical protein
MARNSAKSGDPIDRLLQERQQYTVWLARLDTTSDTASESVRAKIRSDYQARLDHVIEELRSHADDLVRELDRNRDSRGILITREDQAKEIMSEAELRHAVGEYGDDKWQQIRGEAQRNLVEIREQLSKVNDEIAELEKVQSMIATPAVVEPPPPPPAPPPVPEPVAAAPAPAPPPPAPEPPKPADEEFKELSAVLDDAMSKVAGQVPPKAPEPPKPPAPGPGQTTVRPAAATVRPIKPKEGTGTPGRSLGFRSVKGDEVNSAVDELAFLKSVSEDEKTGPSARRASGGNPRPPETLGAPRASPAPGAPAAPPPLTTAAHTLEPAGPSGAELAGRPSIPTAQRTLKCGECGTMNRPTEWYCERCGAELADQ